MYSIDDIYKMLSWNSALHDQEKGIKLASELDDLSLLIQPFWNGESKSLWGNCARALHEVSDDRLEPHLPLLLEWLQDLTWPGAETVFYRLKAFSGEKLKDPVMELVDRVSAWEDRLWLDFVSWLIENDDLKATLPHETLEILQKHYDNPGWWYEEPL